MSRGPRSHWGRRPRWAASPLARLTCRQGIRLLVRLFVSCCRDWRRGQRVHSTASHVSARHVTSSALPASPRPLPPGHAPGPCPRTRTRPGHAAPGRTGARPGHALLLSCMRSSSAQLAARAYRPPVGSPPAVTQSSIHTLPHSSAHARTHSFTHAALHYLIGPPTAHSFAHLPLPRPSFIRLLSAHSHFQSAGCAWGSGNAVPGTGSTKTPGDRLRRGAREGTERRKFPGCPQTRRRSAAAEGTVGGTGPELILEEGGGSRSQQLPTRRSSWSQRRGGPQRQTAGGQSCWQGSVRGRLVFTLVPPDAQES